METKRRRSQRDHRFYKEVMEKLGGETLTLCYQCGTCASSCPVARITDRFNPREVIRLSILGDTDKILSDDSIWLCCSCYNCQERCPQKVEIADVIFALRNIAYKKGQFPKIYSEFASAMTNDGRISKLSRFMERKRSNLGLPAPQPTGIETLQKILSTTGFGKQPNTKEEDK
jgi:heterodisulfide reductase subunit C